MKKLLALFGVLTALGSTLSTALPAMAIPIEPILVIRFGDRGASQLTPFQQCIAMNGSHCYKYTEQYQQSLRNERIIRREIRQQRKIEQFDYCYNRGNCNRGNYQHPYPQQNQWGGNYGYSNSSNVPAGERPYGGPR